MSSYQYTDETPTRQLSGASRAGRQAQRQVRVQSTKPYSRPSSLSTATALDSASSNGIPSNEFGRSVVIPSTAAAFSTPVTAKRAGGLLSSLGRAIAKPISWLSAASSGGPRSDAGIDTFSSLPAFASGVNPASQSRLADRSPGVDVAVKGSGRASGAATSAALEVGRRLATSVRPRLSGDSTADIEAHDSSAGVRQRVLASSSSMLLHRSTGPYLSAPSSSGQRLDNFSVPLTPSAPPRRLPGSHSALHLAPEDAARNLPNRSPSPALSSADVAAYRNRIRADPSHSVREGSVTQSSNSPRPLAYGFGSERRHVGLASSVSAYNSPIGGLASFNLPSRSPLARNFGRSSLGSQYATSEVGGDRSFSHSPFAPRIRAGSVQPGLRRSGESIYAPSVASNAGSRGGSVYGGSTTSMTPKRREWSSLNINLNPTRHETEGEHLMREYARMRTGASDGPAAASPSRAGSVMRESPNPVTGWLGKREASMDFDDARSATSNSRRKRTMLWDPELGFVSQESLNAREPKLPPPKNNAEAILQALESMRTPLGDVRKEGHLRASTVSPEKHTCFSRTNLNAAAIPQPSRHMATVPVPSPFPDRSAPSVSSRLRSERAGSEISNRSESVAPYSRAMRRRGEVATSKTSETGMRAKLKRETPAVRESPAPHKSARSRGENRVSPSKQSRLAQRNTDEVDDDHDDVKEEAPASTAAPNGDVEMRIEDLEPPRNRRGMTTRARAKQPAFVAPEEASLPRTTSKAKGKGKEGEEGKEVTSQKAEPPVQMSANVPTSTPESASTSAAMSRDISRQSDVAKDVAKKDKFVVRADTPGSQGSVKSTLRVGAVKTQRQHHSAGRFALDADDENDDDDMADTAELDKIKLPVMFPTGFKFGGATSSAASSSSETKSADEPSAPGEDAKSASPPESSGSSPTALKEDSLLSRLGPPPASSEPPSFSFGAAPLAKPSSTSSTPPAASEAEKTAPSNVKPAFSFTPLADGSEKSKAPSPFAPAASAFFSAPVSGSATSPKVDQERKSGPVPNFFSVAPKASPPTGSTDILSPGAAAPSKFSFVTPAPKPDTSLPSNSPVPDFFAKSAVEGANVSSSTKSPVTPFSFGAPATAPAPTAEKRKTSVEGNIEPPQKKVAGGGFTFAAPAASNAGSSSFSGFGASSSTSSSTPAFSFGSKVPETTTQTTSLDANSSVPNFFGKPAGGFGASAATASFGTPKPVSLASTNPDKAPGGGEQDGEMMEESPKAPSKPREPVSQPVFQFGSSASSGSVEKKGFTFGQPSQPSTSAPTFSLNNAPQSPAVSSSGFSFSAPITTASSGGTFGVPLTSSNGAQPSNAGFSFGAATPSTSQPFGSGFSQSSAHSQNSAAPAFPFGSPAGSGTNTPSSGAFVFGAQSQQGSQQSQTPSTGFNFTMPPSGNTIGGFGTPTPPINNPGAGSFSFGVNASGPASPAPAFQFGSGAQPPQSPTPFQFGAGASGPQPQQQQQQGMPGVGTNPAQPIGNGAPTLFTMGAASSSSTPGRVIRSLPRSRKR